jgi:benzoate/toluate 1,2-dioxygenase reductase component
MSAHDITLVFEDGAVRRVRARPDESLYLAALRHGIRLLTDCREAACGTCKALCVAGEVALDDYSAEALSAAEARQGYTLPCQGQARSDCVLELPYAAELAELRPAPPLVTRVAAVERVARAVMRLDLDPGTAPAPGFLPGQYAQLAVPGPTARRAYSFATAPGAAGPLSFYIKLIAGGVMSAYMAGRAAPGDALVLEGPYGRFYLRPPQRPIVMVAGGTGLAPMLSMLDHLAAGAAGTPVRLLFGGNTPTDFFALERLRAYGGKGVALAIEYAAVTPSNGWAGASGHVTELLRLDSVTGADVYLCGPPAMIEAGRRKLARLGVPARHIHVETFLPS